ncbi:TraE/TraK family type IV conjugative transfer system protein [Thiomonas sp.]
MSAANYPEALVKAFREGRAWRFAAFAFAGFALIFAGGLVYVSTHSPTTLVPYGFAMAKGPVTVKAGSAANGAYLSYVAQADLGLILDWTPDTVKAQYDRFMNRLSPSLYAAEQAKLVAAAKLNKQNDVTEAFYANHIQYSGDTVQVSGLLKQWAGQTVILSRPVTYTLTYAFTDGTPYVTNLSTPR